MGSIPRLERPPGGGNDNHSSILAWEIPQTEEPEGLQSMGSQRVRYNWVAKQQQQSTLHIAPWITLSTQSLDQVTISNGLHLSPMKSACCDPWVPCDLLFTYSVPATTVLLWVMFWFFPQACHAWSYLKALQFPLPLMPPLVGQMTFLLIPFKCKNVIKLERLPWPNPDPSSSIHLTLFLKEHSKLHGVRDFTLYHGPFKRFWHASVCWSNYWMVKDLPGKVTLPSTAWYFCISLNALLYPCRILPRVPVWILTVILSEKSFLYLSIFSWYLDECSSHGKWFWKAKCTVDFLALDF